MSTPSYSSLTPKQKQMALQRWHQRHNKTGGHPAKPNPLNQEIAPGLTLGDLNRDTSAATGLKYGGLTQQLNALPARTNNWFGQYQAAIKNAQAAQAQQAQQTVAGISQLQQGLNTQAQQAWAGEQVKMAQDAANRGATVDPNLPAQMHGAANVRGILTDSFGAMLANQAANENANLTNRRLTTGLARVQAQQKIAADQAALAKEKGAFKQTYRDQRISDAAKQALENALTQSTLGERAATTAKTIADTSSTRAKTAQTKAETAFFDKYGYKPSAMSPKDAAALAYFNKHGYFPPTGPPKKAGGTTGKDRFGNTRKDRERFRNQWARARSLAHLIRGKGDTVGSLTQLLVAKDSTVPPWMAQAAAQQIILGYVGPHLRSQLKTHGVKGGYSAVAPGATGVTGGTSAGGN